MSELANHLTGTDSERALVRRLAETQPGMAYLAGTGPTGATCHGCRFWDHNGAPQYFAWDGRHGGEIKPSPCAKYRSLTCGHSGPPIEHWNAACKYFEKNETPPALRKPGKKI